ncbi:MAG TPA: hypothetical protein VGA00_06830 [Acidiferrobacterales bacterium]
MTVLVSALGLGACGGGGGEGGAISPPPTVQAIVADLESVINRLDGRLSASATTGSTNGYGYNLTAEGFAFCLPGVPTAPPQIPSTYPNNVYGCENRLALSYTSVLSSTQLTLTAAVPELFVDFYGSISPITSGLEGYVTDSDVAVDITFAITANGDGTYTLDPTAAPIVAVTFNAPAVYTNNAAVDLIGASVVGMLSSYIETSVESAIAQELQVHVQSGAVPNFVF